MRKRLRQVAQAIVWHRIFSIENIWVIPVEVYAKRVSQRNGKDNAKVKYCRLVASRLTTG